MRARRENAKPSLIRRALACLVSAAMVVAFAPTVAWGTSDPGNLTFDIADGDVTIGQGTQDKTIKVTYFSNGQQKTEDNISSDQMITINSSSENVVQKHIVVSTGSSVTANITLSDVDIQFATSANSGSGNCAFKIDSGAAVKLTLEGDNTLVSNGECAGLQVPPGSSLAIEGPGSLSATAYNSGAGIGGVQGGDGGTVSIYGGHVTAIGGGAGIGGGQGVGNGGTVSIYGGHVTAIGDRFSAGIGGGGGGSAFGQGLGESGGNGGEVTVSGGVVMAISTYGAGIGGGIATKGSGDPENPGDSGTFSTGTNGNSVVFASTIADKNSQSSWSGVIFEGASYNESTGKVAFEGVGPAAFGISQNADDNPAATVNIGCVSELSSEHSMTVGSNAAVIVANLDNNGSITNNGKIYVDGSLTGTVSGEGAVYYPLTLNANEGTVSGGSGIAELNGSKYYNSTSGATLPTANNMTKTGYTFAGWYDNANLTGTVVPGISASATGTKTYWAKWEATEYGISYNLNGGSLDQGKTNPDKYTVETETFTLNNPVKTGYTFAGWTETNLSTPSTSVTISKGSTGERSYTANWQPNTNTSYAVKHWLQNVENNSYVCDDSLDETCYGTTGEQTSASAKTLTGFTAKQFAQQAIAGNGGTVVNIYYDRNVCKVTFVDEDGTTVLGENTYKYGTSAANVAKPSDPAKAATPEYSYEFVGWSPSVGDVDSDITYKAVYSETKNKYDVTFDANGHGTAPSAVTGVEYGTTVNAPDPPEAEGYTFGGWFTDASCTAEWVFSTSTVKGATALYAKWTVNQYTITFDTGGGTAIDPITQDYGAAVTKPADPTRSGYTFAGWDREIPAIMPASDMTIKAKWNVIYAPPTYTVPVSGEGSVEVKATVSGSTAVVGEISVKTLEGAVAGGEGGEEITTVTIDLSGAPQGVTQAQLSKSTVENLLAVVNDAGNAVESVTVDLGGAAVVVDAEALAAIAGQAKGGSVTIGVKEKRGETLNGAQQQALSDYGVVELYFEAQVKSGGAEIHDFGGGSVRVSVAFEPQAGHDPARYVVLYVAEDGQLERFATAWATGMLSFAAPHFSAYAVVYVEDATAAAIEALEALPDAGELKASQAKEAVKKAQAALESYALLTDGQKALVDDALIANAQQVVVKGAILVAKADKKAVVGKVKNKAFSVKVGTSKSIYFKTLASAAGTKVTYKKASGSSYITVSKAGKVTAKKGMKKGKTYTAKIKVTCGKSWKYVKVTVKVQ